jgi:hydroxyacylglutathione hydrolase
MILKAVEVGPELNFCYLLGCPKSGVGAIVDPSDEVPAILELAEREGLTVRHILLTHAHSDHCSGVPEVVRATGASIFVHAAEADRFVRHGGYEVVALQDGDTVTLGEVELDVIHTPGHSPGGVSFYHAPSGQALTGDCLFIGYCGRADLEGSDPEALWRSLQRLATLPDETVVYPGHNYGVTPTSTIGEQRATNPYYLCASMDEFVELRLYGTVE